MLAYLTDLPLAVRAARQRASYRHADTGAVAAPSMSYETVLYRDTLVRIIRMRLSKLYRYHIPYSRARF